MYMGPLEVHGGVAVNDYCCRRHVGAGKTSIKVAIVLGDKAKIGSYHCSCLCTT